MPINVPDKLPAINILKEENIFVMDETRAIHQDIRPLKIAVLNLMPTKQITETQLIRILSNNPLQIELELVRVASHVSKNTAGEHLAAFYKDFSEIKDQKFDGLIVTGAPVEHLDFEEVDYWDEIKEIMEWTTTHVTSTLFICWAAQAGLKYFYQIPKYNLAAKIFGVFAHSVSDPLVPLVRGFDDIFMAPHSRYTEVKRGDLEKVSDLKIVAESKEAGVHIVMSPSGQRIFVTGHFEYDPDTLKIEYQRDLSKGINVGLPKNYFPGDNPNNQPAATWRGHANLFFSNWLNYYVYQVTPYINN